MANMQTTAEILAWRILEEETRSGVPHFKTGQHKARLHGDLAQLTYVDVGGHLVMLSCVKRDGEWMLASPQGIRVGHYVVEVVPFPRSFQLTEGMVVCLQKAEEERSNKRSSKKVKG